MNTQQKLKKYLDKIRKEDKKINSFLQLNPNVLQEAKEIDSRKKKGRLYGKIIAVKANINVKGLNCNCASKTLKNYKAPYDATVIKKIKDESALIIGVTNMDEFASGSSGETSAFLPTRNPQNPSLITGGSSSGSAASVSAGFCDMALGSDTGGSIRNPASHCGVVGMKPTYGVVSRYGLIDLSMSLDQIGPLARTVSEAELLFNIIKGKDEKDAVSENPAHRDVFGNIKNITIGLLDFPIQDKRIQQLVDDKVSEVSKKKGWKVKKIKINYIDLAVETYYPLVYVEFFSGTRRFDGRKYGFKIEDVSGPEVIRRILGGSEISKSEHYGRYYHLALKAKKLVEEEFKKVFEKIDCVILPTVPKLPHKIGDKISVQDMYSYDALTIPANLAGNCAISIPVGTLLQVPQNTPSHPPQNNENLDKRVPVGMQIMCDKFQEQKMFQIAKEFEKL